VFVDGREAGTGASVDLTLQAGSWVVYSRCGDVVSRARTLALAAGSHTTAVLDAALDARTRVSNEGVLLRYGTAGEAHTMLVNDLTALAQNTRARRVATRWGANVVVVDPGRRVVTAVIAARDAASQLTAALFRTEGTALPLPAYDAPASGVAPLAPDARVAATPEAPTSANPWPWVVAGTGVALLGVGAAVYFVRNGQETTLSSMCVDRGDHLECPAELAGNGDTIETLETVRIATLIAGSALVAGGLAWWLFDRPRTRSTTARLRVAPSVSVGAIGVVGRF
jgi:hypothetical protein